MKITLVISSLSCGGAERVLVSMAQGLIQRRHEVTVVTLSGKNDDFYEFYELPAGCSRLALGVLSQSAEPLEAIKSNLKRIRVLRRAVQSSTPDVVISFLRITNITAILALLGTKYPLIVTEHNDPKVFSYGMLWETLRRLTYPFCSCLVSVSQGVDLGFASLPKNKRAVIYNPIMVKDDGQTDELPKEVNLQKNWLVSMGRLEQQKGFDLLLAAFAKIAAKYPDWQLLILGRGELREQLLQTRDDLGLSGQVVFTGALNNPFAVLKQAKLFVMASRSEGFPMAHGEALACGLPVVCTDCPSGPSEMVRQDRDGILVPNQNVAALSAAMESLMSNEAQRQKLAAQAAEVLERFGLDAIVTEWEVLINKLLEA
ncbi:glycosyltransferase family 4 protein [Pleurocapsa sp. CCALA 161]|uniref:glycosyltransferase family 4 protein n=1 Tax=Pleurocapsa sp. CCALA 161 TaxID=2107688 RepID=UPI000D07FB8D|nr:glycosyltransferase family 4 protein [Pleurocapsa sp. CCALA 161]PSB09470.1 glycosyltransferase family 4 protein [Pleurocapsa sp. CCALA 161]